VRHNRTLAVAACSVVDAATLVVGAAYPVGCVMSGLLIGYARVSAEEQDLTAQRDGLEQLGVEPSRIYVDRGCTHNGTATGDSGLNPGVLPPAAVTDVGRPDSP
jgi:resolvase-like protein